MMLTSVVFNMTFNYIKRFNRWNLSSVGGGDEAWRICDDCYRCQHIRIDVCISNSELFKSWGGKQFQYEHYIYDFYYTASAASYSTVIHYYSLK